MTMIRARTFCCCIPVRLGVLLIALFGLLGGGTFAIVGAVEAHKVDGSKVAIAIAIAVYALLAFLSALGLVGALGRKLALIKMYFGMLFGHLIFSIAIGAYALHRVFADSIGFYDQCMQSEEAAHDQDPDKVCQNGAKLLKGLITTAFLIFWFFEIWGCLIVGSYSKQLQEEQAVSGVVKDTDAW